MPPSSRRWSVQRLMIGVAVVALTLGLGLELQTRRERDQAANSEAMHRQIAAFHQEQATVCRAELAQGHPYIVKQRNSIRLQDAQRHGLTFSPSTFHDWTAEEAFHAREAQQSLTEAEAESRRRQVAQRRLLIPF